MTVGVCGDFLCRYNVDDECSDPSLCCSCLYHDCEDCVYSSVIGECGEIFCELSDGDGIGQTFSP